MKGLDVFRDTLNVSRETMERFEKYEMLLGKWNKTINLVSKATLEDVWIRHFLDCAACYRYGQTATKWVDLGTGGGFPGAVIAIMAAETENGPIVTCIEADIRKAAFLKSLAIDLGVSLNVVSRRIEDVTPQRANIVSARALAPLTKLLGFAERHLAEDGRAILLKGETWQKEVEEALESYSFSVENHPNPSQSGSSILIIGDVKRA